MAKSMEVGGGGRFAALRDKIAKRKGVRDASAIAASIGREKYGERKMARMSARGRSGR